MARYLVLVCLLVLAAFPAAGEEVINSFDVSIDVKQDGDIVVTEAITVNAEGYQIRRGIFRDLPRYFESQGDRLRYDYDILSVERDGNDEPYETSSEGNAYRIRIGDADRRLSDGEHVYEISYRVKNQIRYFTDHDELYWNVTGSYWEFPIQSARARITLPDGARVSGQSGYTGRQGSTEAAYRYNESGGIYNFETTEPLARHEGLTISLSLEKGGIDPPSAGDQRDLWWQRHGSLAVLLASLIGVFIFLYRSWNRVGRDPARGPVFPLYEPPAGYSPAACHYIYHRGFSGHDALIATFMNLGIKGRIDIDVHEWKGTILTPKPAAGAQKLPGEEEVLMRKLLSDGAITLGKREDKTFAAAYQKFQNMVSANFGPDYFRWNLGYTLIAIALSAAAIIFAIIHATNWNIWRTGLVVAIALVNGLFMYLMPAATKKGEEIRTKIKGFRLYMETAEKLQLNAAKVGGDTPPPMTKKRYETFLPYAIALGVEEPWTEHFEKILPQEAADYHPAWMATHMGRGSASSMNKAIAAGLSTAVAASMPQSSSSSGSSGGGFSGGGGGGGGGGGW